MIVYSVLRPEQIDLTRTRSEGVAGLKGFLEFATRGTNVIAGRTDMFTKADDSLVSEIAKGIETLGYKTRCNIGCSQFRMDIGIIDPENPETYMWVSPVPQKTLERFGLAQRKCDENKRVYKDLLIHRKDYSHSELDNMFIEYVIKSKREVLK